MFWALHSFNFKISNHTIIDSNITRYFSKPEPNMLKNLIDYSFQHFPKKFIHYSYFILISLPIIPILFLCINVSGTYCHSEKQNLESYHRYIDNIAHILVIQVKWSMKVILAFSNRYQLFFHCALNVL